MLISQIKNQALLAVYLCLTGLNSGSAMDSFDKEKLLSSVFSSHGRRGINGPLGHLLDHVNPNIEPDMRPIDPKTNKRINVEGMRIGIGEKLEQKDQKITKDLTDAEKAKARDRMRQRIPEANNAEYQGHTVFMGANPRDILEYGIKTDVGIQNKLNALKPGQKTSLNVDVTKYDGDRGFITFQGVHDAALPNHEIEKAHEVHFEIQKTVTKRKGAPDEINFHTQTAIPRRTQKGIRDEKANHHLLDHAGEAAHMFAIQEDRAAKANMFSIHNGAKGRQLNNHHLLDHAEDAAHMFSDPKH